MQHSCDAGRRPGRRPNQSGFAPDEVVAIRPQSTRRHNATMRFALVLGVAAFACFGWVEMQAQQATTPPPSAGESSPAPADQQSGSTPDGRTGTSPSTSGPIVHEPVAAGVQQNDLRNLPPAEPRKPGDPVKERQDLQRSDGQPR